MNHHRGTPLRFPSAQYLLQRSTSQSAVMIEELAKDYAAYAEVDLPTKMKSVHDTIEDMMVRLEEFESIIGMVQTNGAECMSGHLPDLQKLRPELGNLCKRIDALEDVVSRANADLTALESAVDNAEAKLGVPDKLFAILNPLSFFKKSQESSAATSRSPTFEQPNIYKTDDFFENE